MPNEMQHSSLIGNNDPRDAGKPSVAVSYEPPRLVPLGNLKDILAGGGSNECDGTLPQPGQSSGTC
jgi:hypothetical protein